MSRIGKSTLSAVFFILILAMTTVIVLLCAVFSNAQMENLKESAQISTNILSFEIASKSSEAEMISKLLVEEDNFVNAVESGDKAAIQSTWDSISKSNGIFALFLNSDGIIAMKTDNCLLSSEGVFNAVGSAKNGLSTDSEISLYYRAVAKNKGITAIVGYSYSDPDAVDEVYEQTQSQATIFSDNLRISTTFIGEDGQRAIGTTMNDDIYQKVVVNGETYQKKTKLFGDNYMTTYAPIIDEYGVIKGAFFTGYPMDNVIASRNRAVFVGIIAGLVMMGIAVVGVTVFVNNQIVAPVKTVKAMALQMEQGNLSNNSGWRLYTCPSPRD
ncbi:MAG: cache domain-containing protein [Oscillospiraceae bacterium]|nr:cache domain-containing protein [Oscillospiraceae bacterium]